MVLVSHISWFKWLKCHSQLKNHPVPQGFPGFPWMRLPASPAPRGRSSARSSRAPSSRAPHMHLPLRQRPGLLSAPNRGIPIGDILSCKSREPILTNQHDSRLLERVQSFVILIHIEPTRLRREL